MVELNKDGTVDLNEMAVRIAKSEAGAKEANIGEIKELLKDFAQDLVMIQKVHGRAKMIETIERAAR